MALGSRAVLSSNTFAFNTSGLTEVSSCSFAYRVHLCSPGRVYENVFGVGCVGWYVSCVCVCMSQKGCVGCVRLASISCVLGYHSVG